MFVCRSDGWLTADICSADAPNIIKRFSIRKLRALPGQGDLYYSQLMRIRIPVAVADPGAKVTFEPLCVPELHGHVIQVSSITINPRRIGRPYRYLYGNCVHGPRPCNAFNAVCRVDVIERTLVKWTESPKAIFSGSPVFVPRPFARYEDETDGVLLIDALGADGLALFIVLSAQTFRELARVAVPHRHTQSSGTTWVWEPRCPEGLQH